MSRKPIVMDRAPTKSLSSDEDDSCPSERTSNPCRAFKFATILEKIHISLRSRIKKCRICLHVKKLSFRERREILCKSDFSKICVFERSSKCPRVHQVNVWMMKCLQMKAMIRKCVVHSSLIQSIHNNVSNHEKILQKINR